MRIGFHHDFGDIAAGINFLFENVSNFFAARSTFQIMIGNDNRDSV